MEIVINIEHQILDVSILELILKTIIPAGIVFKFTFSSSIEPFYSMFQNNDSVKVLYISDSLNSNMRGSSTDSYITGGIPQEFSTRIGASDSMKLLHPIDDAYGKPYNPSDPIIEVHSIT